MNRIASIVLTLTISSLGPWANASILTQSADFRPGGDPGGGVVIVDNSSAQRTFTLSDPGSSILSVLVTVNVTSSQGGINANGTYNDLGDPEAYANELFLALTSPAGTFVQLISFSTYGISLDGGDYLVDLTFDDGGSAQGGDRIVAGTFKPTLGLLAHFIGEDPTGVWTITIRDFTLDDAKSLNAWSLTVTTDSVSGVVPESGSLAIWGLLGATCSVVAWRRHRRAKD